MKTKEEIVHNWLPRYTGEKLENFGEYILLTNFGNYVHMFAEWNNVPVIGEDKPMQCATANNISIINFGMGSPTAATVMDLLTAINPKAVLFLGNYWTGTVYTTNRRVWEHDEPFKEYLQKVRAYAIDMETATIFIVGFYNKIPTGALLLVSDQPMIPEGVKTEESDKKVTASFVENHLKIGIDSLKQLINDGLTVRHLKF